MAQSERSFRHLKNCSSYFLTLVRQYRSNSEPSTMRNLGRVLEVGNHARSSQGKQSRLFGETTYLVDVRRRLWTRERPLEYSGDDRPGFVKRILGLPNLRRYITTSGPRRATETVREDVSSVTKTKGPPASARYVRGSVSMFFSSVVPFDEGPVSWASLGLLVVTGVGLLFYFELEKKRRIEAIKHPPEVKQGPSVGKAAIGGPFKLINHDGKVVTDRDFKGNWTLIYFGFTHCPDICPDELVKMAEAIDKIEKKTGVKVVPVFISVDPERDTVEQLREYLKEFHPRLVGLTGTVDAVRKAAKEYRVYYMKTEEDGSDYLVDHSIIMYLMDPNMDFVKFYGKNYDAESLANGVAEEMKNYKGSVTLDRGEDIGETKNNTNPQDSNRAQEVRSDKNRGTYKSTQTQ